MAGLDGRTHEMNYLDHLTGRLVTFKQQKVKDGTGYDSEFKVLALLPDGACILEDIYPNSMKCRELTAAYACDLCTISRYD